MNYSKIRHVDPDGSYKRPHRLDAANTPRIRLHDLRHTAASITLGIYAHATLDMQDQAAGMMEG